MKDETIQIVTVLASLALVIISGILLYKTRQMKIKIPEYEPIKIENEVEEKLHLFYNDEFDNIEIQPNQVN